MSEIVQSEILKTVSEVGDNISQAQQQNEQHYQNQKPLPSHSQQVEVESKKNVSGNGTPTPRVASRAGSQFLPGLHNATLPSKIAIIVGLCQVAVGGAMVLTGILAIRYQSYLFHYGTGLWAGLLSAITGMLGAMCTKKGVPKPTWLCGGRKWQIHVFLLAIILSLSSVVLLAIFSTSGLLQDAKTIMAVEMEDESQLDEILEAKNTSGIIINTVLLLLSILQVLLCFSSLGIAVRVLFKSRRNGSLLSSKGSTGSEVAIRNVGAARNDHLISWLGHQRPNVIPLGFGSSYSQKSNMQKYPTYVAIQPVVYPSPRRMMSYPNHHNAMMQPHPVMLPPLTQQYAFAPSHPAGPQMIPICAVHGATPTPSIIYPHKSRRAGTPASSIISLSVPDHQRRNPNHRRRSIANTAKSNATNSVKSFQTHSRHSSSSKAPSVISAKTESEKNNEVEITEVDVSCTYTGLDRSIAEDFICSMSNSRKESSIEEDSSELESTRI